MTSPRPAGPDMRVIGGVVAILAVVAMLAIFAVTSGDDDASTSSGPEYGATDAIGTALTPLPESGPDPAVGQPAPKLISDRPDGSTVVDPTDLDEPVLLVFLAHWCSHCQAELPRLVTLADGGTFDDIRTVAVLIATDPNRPNYPPSAWLDAEGWGGDRLYDDADGTAARAYGVSSFPFLVLVDEDGTVVERLAGEQAPGVVEDVVDAVAP